jgi:hypothetical protein
MNPWLTLAQRARWPLTAALGLWAVVLVLTVWWWEGVSWKRAGQQDHQQAIQAAQALLAEKQRDWADTQRLAPLAEDLARQGVWGHADRAAWVQAFQRVQGGFPGAQTLGFSLAPPRLAQDAAVPGAPLGAEAGPSGPVAAHWHDLTLMWVGPDEEQFWQFSRTAARAIPGRFRVESCEIKRETSLTPAYQCLWRFVSLSPTMGTPGAPEASLGASAPAAFAAALRGPAPGDAAVPLLPLGTLVLSAAERDLRRRGLSVEPTPLQPVVEAPPPLRKIAGFIARGEQPPRLWEEGGDGTPRAEPGLTGPHPGGSDCGRWRWKGRPVDAGDSLDTQAGTIDPSLPAGAVVRGADASLSGPAPSRAPGATKPRSSLPKNCRNSE